MSLKSKYLFTCISLLFLAFTKQDAAKRMMIKAKMDYFAVDNIGNIYTVKEDEMMKYLPTGKFFVRYSNLKLGNITCVDATNPLKILLYYRDFQQIVFLDDQLSKNSDPISLEGLGYEQTDLVCASANNGFWIYNKQNNELIRFNEASKKIASTGNLKQILRADLTPNFMTEQNGYLYLNSPETGIYVFDIFGAFSKVISIKNLKTFRVNENILYFKKDSTLCSYNHKLFEEACVKIPNSALSLNVDFYKDKTYVQFKDSLIIKGL